MVVVMMELIPWKNIGDEDMKNYHVLSMTYGYS